MTNEEAIARLKAACERVKLLGKPGPRPAYNPGAAPLPTPQQTNPPPRPWQDGDNEGEV